ncbi:MAG: hypothetical protein WCX81_04470, partial [Monoglobales bacterium]
GDYVLHRIVKVKKEGYGLCGDNQKVVEFPIDKEQIIAVVSSIIRKGKTIDKKNMWYRVRAFFWTNCIPLRPIIFKTVMKLKNL